jgi:uncharacterized protein YdhG (YjbR/CyaY superfamily)
VPDQQAAVDAYIDALPPERQAAMRTLRRAIRAAAPDAEEVITYKMPGFRLDGRFFVSYDAYKRHYSLFPASDGVVRGLGDEIRPYLAGRGTIRFPAERPIPEELVRRIIEIRLVEHTTG